MKKIARELNNDLPIEGGDPLMSFSAEKPMRLPEDRLWIPDERLTEPQRLRRVVVDYGDWFHTLTITHPKIEPTEAELLEVWKFLRNWSGAIEMDRNGILPERGENPSKLP